MAKVNSLLAQRFKSATAKLSKMTNLAELSSSGNLSSFSGVFKISPLSSIEEERLQTLLEEYQLENPDLGGDLRSLSAITSEVKAINNQAAILHGERIKKAQEILKNYKEGAFTAWLIAAYGNRQTPYNFLQYYELQLSLPKTLHPKLDALPRQAVYVLASRNGLLEKKEEIIKNYQGEPKKELLSLIRQTFPLPSDDKRAQDLAETVINTLKTVEPLLTHPRFNPTSRQKKLIQSSLKNLHSLLGRHEIGRAHV